MIQDNFRSGPSLKMFLLIPCLIALALIAQGIFRIGGVPDVHIKPGMSSIGKRTPVTIDVAESRRGLTHVTIELRQGDKSQTLAEKHYDAASQFLFWRSGKGKDTFSVEVGRQTMPGLTSGSATILVIADRAGTWLRHPKPFVEDLTLPVQLTPPSLQITSTRTYAAQGGCEAVTYRVGESAVRDGVRAGSWWFPGYPLPGGGKQDRFALFAVPYDMAQPDVQLVVEDAAGNESRRSFIDQFFPKRFRSDNIEISDAFLAKVVPEILSQTPELKDRGTLLDNYLEINRELRRKNADTLIALSRKSRPEFLWTLPFLMVPNSKVMAGFADRRTYLYQKREIDTQIHLGYDLAVTKQFPIPAANDGIVLFAGYFGIYGNAVVLDHGYGLLTIYGHMSSISVAEGQKAARGSILGKTGETGLAGGDHLHFCTILDGLPVNPVEWWDGHWIGDRIAKKLGAAFPFSAQ